MSKDNKQNHHASWASCQQLFSSSVPAPLVIHAFRQSVWVTVQVYTFLKVGFLACVCHMNTHKTQRISMYLHLRALRTQQEVPKCDITTSGVTCLSSMIYFSLKSCLPPASCPKPIQASATDFNNTQNSTHLQISFQTTLLCIHSSQTWRICLWTQPEAL